MIETLSEFLGKAIQVFKENHKEIGELAKSQLSIFDSTNFSSDVVSRKELIHSRLYHSNESETGSWPLETRIEDKNDVALGNSYATADKNEKSKSGDVGLRGATSNFWSIVVASASGKVVYNRTDGKTTTETKDFKETRTITRCHLFRREVSPRHRGCLTALEVLTINKSTGETHIKGDITFCKKGGVPIVLPIGLILEDVIGSEQEKSYLKNAFQGKRVDNGFLIIKEDCFYQDRYFEFIYKECPIDDPRDNLKTELHTEKMRNEDLLGKNEDLLGKNEDLRTRIKMLEKQVRGLPSSSYIGRSVAKTSEQSAGNKESGMSLLQIEQKINGRAQFVLLFSNMIERGDVTENIRSRQIASLKQVLNFNQPVNASIVVEPVGKLLILDEYGQEIISPIIRVKQLRELGVTLNLLIDAERKPLPDVPAIYFVAPVDTNIQIICDDLKKAMYESYYLNMIYPISTPNLEELAASAVQGGATQKVQKLMDHYLSFISLEDHMFVLRKYTEDSPFSFFAINDAMTDASKMREIVNLVANGLFAVCVTLDIVPIIICSRNNAAEQVAEKLDQKIRDNLRDVRNNLFTQENVHAGQLNLHRPVMVIADRSMDLSTMLQHTWTYQALISDVLNMQLNRVRMTDEIDRRDEYDMCSDDKFWVNFKGSPFPLVAEAIEDSLDFYRKNEDEIKRLKNAMNIENPEDEQVVFALDDATAKPSSAAGNLPELLEQKRLIDLHTDIATTLLENIEHRKLDVLFETEEKLLNGQSISVTESLQLCANNNDALRLILITLCSCPLTQKERREILAFMDEKVIDPSAYHFVQKLKALSNMNNYPRKEVNQGAGTKTVNIFSKTLNHSSRFVMEGVKNLVPKKHNLPITMMVDELINARTGVSGTLTSSSAESDEFRYFDPKLLQNSSKDPIHARAGQLAMDFIVFVVGGGNYVEYQNVHEYGKSNGLQRITYGCTEMVNPMQFVGQLTRLGKNFK